MVSVAPRAVTWRPSGSEQTTSDASTRRGKRPFRVRIHGASSSSQAGVRSSGWEESGRPHGRASASWCPSCSLASQQRRGLVGALPMRPLGAAWARPANPRSRDRSAAARWPLPWGASAATAEPRRSSRRGTRFFGADPVGVLLGSGVPTWPTVPAGAWAEAGVSGGGASRGAGVTGAGGLATAEILLLQRVQPPCVQNEHAPGASSSEPELRSSSPTSLVAFGEPLSEAALLGASSSGATALQLLFSVEVDARASSRWAAVDVVDAAGRDGCHPATEIGTASGTLVGESGCAAARKRRSRRRFAQPRSARDMTCPFAASPPTSDE